MKQGTLGCTIQIALIATVLYRLLCGVYKGTQGEKVDRTPLASGLVSFIAIEMTESTLLENSLVTCLYYIVLAIAVQSARKADNGGERWHSKALASTNYGILTISSIAVLSVCVRHRIAESYATKVVAEIAHGSLENAVALSLNAGRMEQSVYNEQLYAFTTARAATARFQPEKPLDFRVIPQKRNELASSLKSYSESIGRDPYDDNLWHNRAWVRMHWGKLLKQQKVT